MSSIAQLAVELTRREVPKEEASSFFGIIIKGSRAYGFILHPSDPRVIFIAPATSSLSLLIIKNGPTCLLFEYFEYFFDFFPVLTDI